MNFCANTDTTVLKTSNPLIPVRSVNTSGQHGCCCRPCDVWFRHQTEKTREHQQICVAVNQGSGRAGGEIARGGKILRARVRAGKTRVKDWSWKKRFPKFSKVKTVFFDTGFTRRKPRPHAGPGKSPGDCGRAAGPLLSTRWKSTRLGDMVDLLSKRWQKLWIMDCTFQMMTWWGFWNNSELSLCIWSRLRDWELKRELSSRTIIPIVQATKTPVMQPQTLLST